MTNILQEYRDYHARSHTKRSATILNALNRDIVSGIIVDSYGVVYIEPVQRGGVPDYIHDDVMRWARDKGYTPISDTF